MMVVGHNFAEKLAKLLDARFVDIEKRTFPDGEVCPRILTDKIDKHVVVAERMMTTEYHNHYLVEVLLTVKNLKSMGAENIDVVMPYFVYSRQDNVFRSGEPFSAKFVLEMLADAGATRFFTVSSHMDRDKEMLSFSPIPAYNINGFAAVTDHMKTMKLHNPIIVGPDEGAQSYIKDISSALGCEGVTFHKERNLETGNITMKADFDMKGKDVIIVDDMVSSGATIVSAIDICKKAGAKSVYCVVVHITAQKAADMIAPLVEKFIACDTIHSAVSAISVEKLIADKIKSLA